MDAHLTRSAEDPNNKAFKAANYDAHFTLKLMPLVYSEQPSS